jgi:hypothetical protein
MKRILLFLFVLFLISCAPREVKWKCYLLEYKDDSIPTRDRIPMDCEEAARICKEKKGRVLINYPAKTRTFYYWQK